MYKKIEELNTYSKPLKESIQALLETFDWEENSEQTSEILSTIKDAYEEGKED